MAWHGQEKIWICWETRTGKGTGVKVGDRVLKFISFLWKAARKLLVNAPFSAAVVVESLAIRPIHWK